MQGAYATTIVMYSYWIDSLSIIQCSSLSLSTGFILEYDLSTATATLFLFSFTWSALLQPLAFNMYMSLGLKWVSCRELYALYKGLFFGSYPVTPCLLIEAFNYSHLK